MVAPIGSAHEKRVAILPAQIRARLEIWPETRVLHNLVIARPKRLQFRPSIDLSLNKPACLDRLQHPIVIKIREARLPRKSAARQTELFTSMDKRRDALLH